MARVTYAPSRGDIVWIDFDPTKGREQRGRRPALVISQRAYNKLSGRALCCPVTSKPRGYVFEVPFTGAQVAGAILADQVRTMDWSRRRAVFIERAPSAVMDEVEGKLMALVQG